MRPFLLFGRSEFLEELIDVPVVLARVDDMHAAGDWPEDLVIAQSLSRLRVTMMGQDPSFADPHEK